MGVKMKNKIFLGWFCISIALGISAYANYNCSFGCQGVYGQIFNPLSIVGAILYVVGTFLIIKTLREETNQPNQSIEIEGGGDVKAENIIK